MRSLIIFLALGAAVTAVAKSGFFARPDSGFASTAPSLEEPQILAATFTSAWCSACKIIEPRLKIVRSQFSGAPVRFVEFDFTFGEAADNAPRAAALGMGDIYDRFKAATGYTLIIDAQTGALLDRLTTSDSADSMRARLTRAIEDASRADAQDAAADLSGETS
ncbi:MAG: thioredoxin [Pseudomonadota bacterium]